MYAKSKTQDPTTLALGLVRHRMSGQAPFFTPVPTTPTSRVVDRVAAGVCLIGVVMLPISYGLLSLGLASFYAALQSFALHAVRVNGYTFPESLRYATTGLAFGMCLSLHAVTRAFHNEKYLEYVGGPVVEGVVQGVTVSLDHIVVPVFALLHLRGAGVIDPLVPMFYVAVEASVIALVHELVSTSQPRQLEDGGSKVLLLVEAAAASAGWVLLFETLNRVFFATRLA